MLNTITNDLELSIFSLFHISKDFTIQALPVLKPQKKFKSIIIFYFYLYLLIQALPVLTSVGRGKPLLKVTVGGEIVSYYHIISNIHFKNCAELCICICHLYLIYELITLVNCKKVQLLLAICPLSSLMGRRKNL